MALPTARYPAPPRNRGYDTQAYQQQQQQYYGNRGYAPAPQGYYYQPRQQYYQPRGLFQLSDCRVKLRRSQEIRRDRRPQPSVARASWQIAPCANSRDLLPAVVKYHACGYRDDEDDNPRRQRREAFQRRSRA